MHHGLTLSRHLVVRGVLLLWAIAVAASLLISLERVERPFPGFILPGNMVLGSTDLADWSGPQAGLQPLDHIVAMDGQPVSTASAVIGRVRQAPAGTPFAYTLADGRTLTVPSMTFSWWEYARSTLTMWLGAAFHLALGGWVLAQRPHLPSAVGHWRYCQIFALFLLPTVAGEHLPFATLLNLIACAMMTAGLIELGLAFPQRPADSRVERDVRQAAWGATALLAAGVLLGLAQAAWFPLAFYAVIAGPSLAMVGVLAAWAFQATSHRFAPPVRGQARMALAGLGLSLVPSVFYTAALAVDRPLPGFEFAFLGFCAFPAAIAFAIVRHQAFDIRYVLRRATFYALLTAGLGGVYLAVAMAGHWLFGRLLPDVAGASVGGFAAALAVAWALKPAHGALQRLVDRWFLGERPDPLGTLAAFGAEADRLEPKAIATQLAAAVREALGARWVEFRWNGEVAAAGARPAAEVPAAELVIRPKEGPLGALEVGPRQDDAAYGEQERALLAVLAQQAAFAIDRAMLFEATLQLSLREATAHGRAEAREQLLRQVVHDLGTELSNIAVATDLAGQMPGEPAPLASIQASLERIDRFLADKRYRLQAESRPRSACGDGLAAAIATVVPVLDRKGQRLEVASSGHESLVPLSEVELAQVIVNVVENASKFSPADSRIRLQVTLEGRHMVLAVEDDGPGVPARLLGAVGDGQRGDGAAPGHGLGLQNCRALVASAGGTLSWHNGDSGAVVEVRLPVLG